MRHTLNKKYVRFPFVERKKRTLPRRKTVMLDANNHYRLQMLQSKLLEKSEYSISFSFVVGEMIRRTTFSKRKIDIKKSEQADRITLMLDDDVFKKLQLELSREIRECAQNQDNDYSPSFSRVLNRSLEEAFDKNIDKKIIKDFQND